MHCIVHTPNSFAQMIGERAYTYKEMDLCLLCSDPKQCRDVILLYHFIIHNFQKLFIKFKGREYKCLRQPFSLSLALFFEKKLLKTGEYIFKTNSRHSCPLLEFDAQFRKIVNNEVLCDHVAALGGQPTRRASQPAVVDNHLTFPNRFDCILMPGLQDHHLHQKIFCTTK